ncbi:hypothetical protein F511_07245 [Dorcoceras hygrometricum]|uniref:Uncharacterized protein n=1 Tax=Dorcoceras hygrometricum TaxID=472368 RepID=A0A2Z7ATW2_9LAMI|nr:hypothetical protein F511_07245 [Dorcoceras hygrometricum]
MFVGSVGIYELNGPYCKLTMTDWFLQTVSVIPRGSWDDVARALPWSDCCVDNSPLPSTLGLLPQSSPVVATVVCKPAKESRSPIVDRIDAVRGILLLKEHLPHGLFADVTLCVGIEGADVSLAVISREYVDVSITVERCVDDVDFTVVGCEGERRYRTLISLLGSLATMRRVVNYHSSWERQQQVELFDASGNPGFTAGRGFNPAGGAPGGG